MKRLWNLYERFEWLSRDLFCDIFSSPFKRHFCKGGGQFCKNLADFEAARRALATANLKPVSRSVFEKKMPD